ncbi:MAG: transcription elongation factor GreA [Sutterellaceae bacterium]|nr:transcription elongation factor GreA [Sutterellaceae bacterium]
MDKRIPITVAGAEKLRMELDELKRVKRPAVVQAIAEAREKGDLSENAEYDAAKEMQGHIEGRIAELEGKMGVLQIIDPASLKNQVGDRIVFGATVELEDEDGQARTYQLVGDDEADIKQNRISISSPLARSLIGKFEGDEVTCPAPKGLVHYVIVSVDYI